jgi:hypothetical protein
LSAFTGSKGNSNHALEKCEGVKSAFSFISSSINLSFCSVSVAAEAFGVHFFLCAQSDDKCLYFFPHLHVNWFGLGSSISVGISLGVIFAVGLGIISTLAFGLGKG